MNPPSWCRVTWKDTAITTRPTVGKRNAYSTTDQLNHALTRVGVTDHPRWVLKHRARHL